MDKRVRNIIDESKNIVFFGGAGVSTESNIPDFRSEEGLYSAKSQYGYAPEEILSHTFFISRTDIFFDYYKKNLIYKDAMPNNAHIALAKLEAEGKNISIITQNIDGLHQKAGSKKVYELHGSVLRNYCMNCHEFYDLDYILNEDNCGGTAFGIPKCKKCGGIVKPDVVLYEEALDNEVCAKAIGDIQRADCLIVGGTSLTVYPAAGFLNYYSGKELILINKSETQYDRKATLLINDAIGEVMSYE